ncbi:hypothetical protein E2C01_004625 [Portunus trituberculatus]|uniref:Uncharacterized protein n=1 Tax=Portunus trituberculatus TaxID=210409 RepID=A0A5B7CS75_PORTR|nr:hypothetical protein [Portunus trituberculatus]
MFKAYTLSLRKTLEASLPGVRGTHQPKARKATADKGTEQLEKSKHEERKGDVGVDKGNLERTSEEHWALVAGQVFKSWTGDCPRRTYQSSLASALTLRPADVSEGSAGPWNGHLPQAELLKLTQLADELGLGKDARQLAWWLVGSRLASVDAEWILSHVKDIQASLGKNAYTEEEKADLLHSLTLYIYSQIKRLKSLHSAFPSSSSKQLTFTLRSVTSHSCAGRDGGGSVQQHCGQQLPHSLCCRTLRSLEEHPATRRLLDTAGQPPIPEDVTAALQRHVHEWWSEVIQMKPSSAEEREGQLRQAVNTVTRVPALLLQESEMYHHIFQRELSVSYDNLCRREVRNRLDHLSSSLLVPSESKPQAPLKGKS